MNNDQRVPLVSPMSRKKLEKIANDFIKDLYPELLERPQAFPVQEYLEFSLGYDMDYELGVERCSAGVEGYIDPCQRELVLSESTYAGLIENDGRARFCGIHEVSHVLLEHGEQLLNRLEESKTTTDTLLFRRTDIPAYRCPEWQANYTASAILMPYQALRIMERLKMLDEHNVMQIFQVSRAAAKIRIEKYLQLKKEKFIL